MSQLKLPVSSANLRCRQMGRRYLLLAVLSALMLTSLELSKSPPAAASSKPPLKVLVMGDSFSAGNGAGDFYGPDKCYRSKKNWASLYGEYLKSTFAVEVINHACSGATTDHVLNGQDMGEEEYLPGSDGRCPTPNHPQDEELTFVRNSAVSGGGGVVVATAICRRRIKPQIDFVNKNYDIVVFTLGGNDVAFDDIVKQCFVVGLRDPGGCREKVNEAYDVLNGRLKSDLKNVLGKIKSLDRTRPDTKIVLLGYPFLEMNENLVLKSGRIFADDEYEVGKNVRQFGRDGDKVQREAFNEVFGSEVGTRAFYILDDLKTKFGGNPPSEPSHEPCARGNFTQLIACNDSRWVHEVLDTKIKEEWYHPNTLGHQAYRDLLIANPKIGQKGPPGPSEGSVDVVFVIDTTGSMGDDIAGVKNFASQFVDDLTSRTRSYRVALVDYRDFPARSGSSGDYPSKVRLNFTDNKSSIQGAINGLSLGDGGDFPETVWSGLEAGIALPWRPGVKKVVIQIGDAPPLDPEPISGLTATDIVRQARAVDPANVYAVDVSSSGAALSVALRKVVTETDGRVITSSSSEDIGKALEEIVRDAVTRPFTFLNGPYLGKVGSVITLDGGGSFDNDGSIVKYEWDLNGDATYDVTTIEPVLSHQFNQLFDGFVGLRVTDNGGSTAEATAITRVTSDGDETPDLLDNCPAANNPGQEDFDVDGIGDVCDATPYPLTDKDGIELSTGLIPVQFSVAGQAGQSAIYASGTPKDGGTEGTVSGVVRDQPVLAVPIKEAGMTTIDGNDVLVVRFIVGDVPWELRYRNLFFGIGAVEICGPPGCETGTGIKFDSAGMPLSAFAPFGINIPGPGTTTTTSTSTTSTTVGSTTTTIAPTTTTTTTSPLESTTTTTASVTTTTSAVTSGSCVQLKRQLDRTSDPRVTAQIVDSMRTFGCPT